MPGPSGWKPPARKSQIRIAKTGDLAETTDHETVSGGVRGKSFPYWHTAGLPCNERIGNPGFDRIDRGPFLRPDRRRIPSIFTKTEPAQLVSQTDNLAVYMEMICFFRKK